MNESLGVKAGALCTGKGKAMKKEDLVKEVAGAVQSRKEAHDAVDCIFRTIQAALERDEKVTLAGFGSFRAEKRSARKARNPRTGEPLEIRERRVPKFVPGAALRKAVDSGK